MLFRMLRTQTVDQGTLRLGVTYDPGKDAALVKLATGLISAGFAETVTEEQLAAEKIKSEKLAAASALPKKRVKEAVDLSAAKAAAAQSKADADEAKANEAAAKKEAEEAKAEVDALAARIAELEAQAAAKGEGQTQE